MNYVKLIFELKTEDDADVIAAILSDIDCRGFEENENEMYAYLNEENFHAEEIAEMMSPFSFNYRTEIIPHENWNTEWESNFQPIKINHEVGLRADFHPPFNDCKYDIVITPKMSFGTGHHETTQMMLEYACETDFASKSVFDFGCGTGVLAIFAALKGANPVLGIDNDPWSVENSIENCARNNCEQIKISIDDIQKIHQTFDIILANINLNILLANMAQMKKLLSPGGEIFLSGILYSDIPTLMKTVEECGLHQISFKQKKDWVALHIN